MTSSMPCTRRTVQRVQRRPVEATRVSPFTLLRPREECACTTCQSADVVHVPVAHPCRLASLVKPLERILPHGCKHLEPRLGTVLVVPGDGESLVEQTGERDTDVGIVIATHLLDRCERRSYREHTDASEQRAFALVQQAVTPIQGRAQRPLSRRDVH